MFFFETSSDLWMPPSKTISIGLHIQKSSCCDTAHNPYSETDTNKQQLQLELRVKKIKVYYSLLLVNEYSSMACNVPFAWFSTY